MALFQSMLAVQESQDISERLRRPSHQARPIRASPPATMVEIAKKAKGHHSLTSPEINATQPVSSLQLRLPSTSLHTQLRSEPLSEFVSGIHAPDKLSASLALIVYILSTLSLIAWYWLLKHPTEPMLKGMKCGWPFQLALLVCLLLAWIVAAYMITIYFAGAIVQGLIESYDADLLGVEVHIESLRLNPFAGRVEFDNLEIENPPGYTSAYLLRAKNIKADVAFSKYLFSFLKSLDLDLSVDGVKAIYDQYLLTSNVDEVLDHLKSSHPQKSESSQANHSSLLSLHKVSVTNCVVRTQLGFLGSVGPSTLGGLVMPASLN